MRRHLLRAAISLAGMIALVAFGWIGVQSSRVSSTQLGGLAAQMVDTVIAPIERLSYDVPFLFRGHILRPEVCLIYMDELSMKNLKQGDLWSRKLHASLIKRLTEDGARAVVFDVIFDKASDDPEEDQALVNAFKENGHVYIGAGLDISADSDQSLEKIITPHPMFRRVVAGWGLLAFRPVDPDYSVRQLYSGNEQKPSLLWVVASKLRGDFDDSPEARLGQRWISYYGPAGWLSNVSYYKAINGQDSPPGFFKDKIVVIGGRLNIGTLKLGKDEFGTPWSRWRSLERGAYARFAPGAEVQATVLLNLLNREWLTRLPENLELTVVIGCGVVFGLLFSLLRPLWAITAGVLGASVTTAGTFWLHYQHNLWFAWLIPVGVQIPIGLAWSLGVNYALENRKRRKIRQALSHYLSREMAGQIDDDLVDLRPGGKVVEATVMFTDLEGFTTLSESLDDPEKLASILTQYFTRTTSHVFEHKGMISKYIGDAVLAVWGAALPDAQHATNAARAAQGMASSVRMELDGRLLHTRVGLHSGRMLAGNLGSAQRFDYTVIGDAVNFASRLEGMNKYFDTDILISDEVRKQIGPQFITRRIGTVQVSGKNRPAIIHELLTDHVGERPEWVKLFESAVDSFVSGQLAQAEVSFQHVLEARPHDGPTLFYLKQIASHEGTLPPKWTGVLTFTTK